MNDELRNQRLRRLARRPGGKSIVLRWWVDRFFSSADQLRKKYGKDTDRLEMLYLAFQDLGMEERTNVSQRTANCSQD